MGTSSSKVLGIRRSTQSVAPRGSDLSVCATEQSQSQSPLQQGERERGEQRKGGSATFSPDVSFQSPSGDDSPIKMYANGGGKEGLEGDKGGGALPGSLRAKHHGQRGTAGAVGEERPRPLADEPVPTAGPHMPEKWQRGDTIGTGSFGSVFIGLNNMTGELLAVKEVAVNVEAHKMKEAVEQLECEVRAHTRRDAPDSMSTQSWHRDMSSTHPPHHEISETCPLISCHHELSHHGLREGSAFPYRVSQHTHHPIIHDDKHAVLA